MLIKIIIIKSFHSYSSISILLWIYMNFVVLHVRMHSNSMNFQWIKNSSLFHFSLSLSPCFTFHINDIFTQWLWDSYDNRKSHTQIRFDASGTVEMPKEDHGVLIISVAAVVSFLTCLLCTLCHRKRKRRHHRQLHRNANYDSTTSATGDKFIIFMQM